MKSSETKKSIIAARIREARVMSGLSQSYVANELGVHRPSVSEIESGNRSVPAEEISRMAELFAVSISWLSGEGADTLDIQDTKIQLAARELQKLKKEDLDRLLRILAAMNNEDAK